MPRGVKKENLPTKVCVVCQRSFNWRKKWERNWEDITTCSNRYLPRSRVVCRTLHFSRFFCHLIFVQNFNAIYGIVLDYLQVKHS